MTDCRVQLLITTVI